MFPPPIALGLTLCEKVIIEEGTRNATLVSTFTKLNVERFPSEPKRFAVYCVLTDGVGDATIELIGANAETEEVIYRFRNHLQFPDRLSEVRVLIRVNGRSFPSDGKYLFMLLIDGDWITHRHLQVALREE